MQESNSIATRILVYGLGNKMIMEIAWASVDATDFNSGKAESFLTDI